MRNTGPRRDTPAKSERPSTRSARPKRSTAVDLPFSTKVWTRARAIAQRYQFVFAHDDEVGFLGRTVEMPLVMSDGRSVEECAASVLEATTLAVATLLEAGERAPAPAREGRREHQMNIRLTAEEKLALEEAARQRGFRSVSDYARHAALDNQR